MIQTTTQVTTQATGEVINAGAGVIRDERRGMPSASGMERLLHCPASFAMERACPAPPTVGDDATSGTRMHAVLAGAAPESTLSAAELHTVELCRAQRQRLCADFTLGSLDHAEERSSLDDGGCHLESSADAACSGLFDDGGSSTAGAPLDKNSEDAACSALVHDRSGDAAAAAAALHLEERLGLTALGTVLTVTPESQARFVFTGQADLVLVQGERALVIDYKTGRADVSVAVDNPQLAALAVLVWRRHRVRHVRVAIVQPWSGPPTVADYSVNALVLAESWLRHALRTAAEATPDDARVGDWCRWCKARAHCPAFKQQALRQLDVVRAADLSAMDGETQRRALFARAMELPPATLAASYRGLEMVRRFVAAIEGAAKERAATDAEFQQHYTLREKKGRRTVTDVGAVFARCHEHGVSPAQFTAACSVPLGEIKELLKTATGAKGRALESLTAGVLEGAVEMSRPSFELVAVHELGAGEAAEP